MSNVARVGLWGITKNQHKILSKVKVSGMDKVGMHNKLLVISMHFLYKESFTIKKYDDIQKMPQ